MFEVTLARLEAMAAADAAIAAALVSKASGETVATVGADSPDLVAASAALVAAKAAVAVTAGAGITINASRVVMIEALITLGAVGVASAGENAAFLSAVADTA